MATKTWLVFVTADAQGYEEFVKIRILPSAFGTGVPTTAKIEALGDAIFGTDKVSDQIISRYYVMVENDAPGSTGGNGDVATATAVRTRSEIDSADFPFSLPGLNKANVSFDPTNPNSISTTGALWDAIRAALVDAAIAWQAPDSIGTAPVSSANTMQVANAFQGRRAPKRVR
jgi:hypothetical protein